MSEEKPRTCQYCARWCRLHASGGECQALRGKKKFKRATESCMLWTDGKKGA